MKKNNLVNICFSLVLCLACSTNLQGAENDCTDCPLPRHPDITIISKDETLNVSFKDGRPPIYGVHSIKRETVRKYGRLIQAITIKKMIDNKCVDSVLLLDDISELKASGLGAGGQTLVIPVLQAREFYRPVNLSALRPNFIEARVQVGMYGADASKSIAGFSNPLIGMSALLSPFGRSFGDQVKLAVGGGVFFEGGRMRIPVFPHLRWTFMGSEREEEYYNYFPTACKFGIYGEKPIRPTDRDLEEVPGTTKLDSTVYFQRNVRLIKDSFRPFVFVEGGPILNGVFDGSGKTPSVNPNDYGQYFFSIGAGLPFYDFLVASIGYKYQRFNVRVPCPACTDQFIVNTTTSQGIELMVGVNFTY